MGDPKLLTVQDVAAMLGVNVKTVYNWCEWGRIPHVKVGRLVRFRTAELDRWLDEQRVPAEVRSA